MLRSDRGFAMLAVKFSGGKMEDYMPWVMNKNKDEESEVDNILLELGFVDQINKSNVTSLSNEEVTWKGRKILRC